MQQKNCGCWLCLFSSDMFSDNILIKYILDSMPASTQIKISRFKTENSEVNKNQYILLYWSFRSSKSNIVDEYIINNKDNNEYINENNNPF